MLSATQQYLTCPVLAVFGVPEWAIIALAVLLLFGGKKLPELARGLGKGLREFKREFYGIKNDLKDAPDLDADAKEPSDDAGAQDRPDANGGA